MLVYKHTEQNKVTSVGHNLQKRLNEDIFPGVRLEEVIRL